MSHDTHPPRQEPIAIVGSGCRFAGGATSPSKLWDLLVQPTDLSREPPADRFNIKAFYHLDGEYHGTTNSSKGYWLDQDPRAFDAGFFHITPKEAEAMDPQQRLLLEVVYEALESAGYTLQQYAGQNVGVYAGVMTADYDTLSQRDDLYASQYYATGNARSIVANRISHAFDFAGPSVTIDTACSSSLVALHQAVLSLRAGHSAMACVAGANLMLTPEQFCVEANLHMLSPGGRCRMWDAGADGYARGEGVAALLLKPLRAALAAGDHVVAVVRETGVNSDGRTPGITMPSPAAQARLIRETYARAGLDPRKAGDRCQYFEAHGTGTPAGDPREASAIEAAFFGSEHQQQRAGDDDTDVAATVFDLGSETGLGLTLPPVDTGDRRPLLVGSIKTVIGHAEGAAGLAGVLKVVQAMRHGLVPPNLHLDRLSPSVEPFCSRLEIPTRQPVAWPEVAPGQPRRASVNSFGFGGTNAHAIVEAYLPDFHGGPTGSAQLEPPENALVGDASLAATLPLCLSAASQKSLHALAARYRAFLTSEPSLTLNELAWQTYAHRTAFPFRVAVAGESIDAVVGRLDALLGTDSQTASSPTPAATGLEIGYRSKTRNSGRPALLGVFTGQGAQWATMSKGLLTTSQVYSNTITALDAVLQSCPTRPSWRLRDEIAAPAGASRLQEAAIAQPLCTALQIALVDLLQSLNLSFACVVGHSSGEIAAAYAAGRLSARDAILIAYYRGLYAHHAGGTAANKRGAMLAAGLSQQDAAAMLSAGSPYHGAVCIAACNSPESVTLSGDADAIHQIRDELVAKGVFARFLQVDTAYHSPHMAAPAALYSEALIACHIRPLAKAADRPIWISSVYGAGEPSTEELHGAYWRDNMLQPVLFYQAVERALRECGPFDCAVEVGPHPALKAPTGQIVQAAQAEGTAVNASMPHCGVLSRGKDDTVTLAEFIGFMWTRFGTDAMDVRSFAQNSSRPQLLAADELPSYPWDHSQMHWRESRLSRQFHRRREPPHELLGVRTRDDNDVELRWRNMLKLDKVPWLAHHCFQGQALVPASAYCVMALDAMRVLLGSRAASLVELAELEILSGIALDPDSPGVEVLCSLTALRDLKRERLAGQVAAAEVEAVFVITSGPPDGAAPMKKNFSCRVIARLGEPKEDVLPRRQTAHAETLPVSTEGFYQMMDESELRYTGPFKALGTLERRFNFATASLQRSHQLDTTALCISPATLDSCLQSTFATISAPGDKALWTAFLPKAIETVRFSMAAVARKVGASDKLVVDSYLTSATPTTRDGPAKFIGDVCIFDDEGRMEIQIESLTVASLAATPPEKDHELYLHTIFDVDPETAIVQPAPERAEAVNLMLLESVSRVASFYRNEWRQQARKTTQRSRAFGLLPSSSAAVDQEEPDFHAGAWPHETRETLDQFIHGSPYFHNLDLARSLGQQLPQILPAVLPSLVDDAHQLTRFQKHMGRVVRQIVHRYPSVHVLDVTDPELGLTEHLLEECGMSCLSFTVGSKQTSKTHLSGQHQGRVVFQELDIASEPDPATQDTLAYDLVVLSTSSLGSTADPTTALGSIRHRMRPGAFLLLVHAQGDSLKHRMLQCVTTAADTAGTTTNQDDWSSCLTSGGFVESAAGATQEPATGFHLMVRQAECSEKSAWLQPLSTANSQQPEVDVLINELLIVGGQTSRACFLSTQLQGQLESRCPNISLANRLEDVQPERLTICSSIILLADLDQPILTSLAEPELATLKTLFQPGMTVLWVTLNARLGNADHATSFGFARTLLAETAGLVLQMLDLEELTDESGQVVTDAFASLALSSSARQATAAAARTGAEHNDFLWTFEPEIYMESGRRLVPRVMPYTQGNNGVNASRRVVTKPVNTLESCVELVPAATSLIGSDPLARHEAKVHEQSKPDTSNGDQVSVQVHYSSVQRVALGPPSSAYLGIGRSIDTGELLTVLSDTKASFASVPRSRSVPVPSSTLGSPREFVCLVLRELLALSGSSIIGAGETLVLINPDDAFLQCARQQVNSATGKQLRVFVTEADKTIEREPDVTHLHPSFSERELKFLFPPATGYILDFEADQHKDVTERLLKVLPNTYKHLSTSGLHSFPSVDPLAADDLLRRAVEMATTLLNASSYEPKAFRHSQFQSPQHLLSLNTPIPPFHFVDWRADRTIAHVLPPLAQDALLFRPDRTYVFVGLTRDLGQSLCRLLVQHGARNLVLASRSPDMTPRWRDELMAQGCRVAIGRLDVTELSAVQAFRRTITEEWAMPPVAGVINGAMVLDDGVFSQMSLDTFERVMRPKTLGSRNLDCVFDAPDMDFFIMTSSFAAVGGHGGQANYAAANMYMNGLATARRARGRAATALNIGVIYGLGFLHRERAGLYDGLAREGYPPISERDLHHMFLEAVTTGKPVPGQLADLTTGLRRFRRVSDSGDGAAQAGAADDDGQMILHWHRDPRFSHFTVRSDRNGDLSAAAAAAAAEDASRDPTAASAVRATIEKATNPSAVVAVLLPALLARLENLLQCPRGTLAGDSAISELGVDSLAAIEIRSWMWRAVGRDVAVLKILGAASVTKLCEEIAVGVLNDRQSKQEAAAAKAPVVIPVTTPLLGASDAESRTGSWFSSASDTTSGLSSADSTPKSTTEEARFSFS